MQLGTCVAFKLVIIIYFHKKNVKIDIYNHCNNSEFRKKGGHTCFTNGGFSLSVEPIKANDSLQPSDVMSFAATWESAVNPSCVILRDPSS